MSYKNQKSISVQRTNVDKYYTKFSNDCLDEMQRNLTTSEFSVMIRLLMNVPDKFFDLSPKKLSEQMDLSPRTIRETIIPTLIKKGYITQINGNKYRVTDTPSQKSNGEK